MKGCKFILAEIDASKAPEAATQTIEGVSFLKNFVYEENGLRCWKAYNQGQGKFVKLDVDNTPIVTGLTVVQAHNQEVSSKGYISQHASSAHTPLFFCHEPGCVMAFHSHEEAETHMDTGKHSVEKETVTSFDKNRKKWAVKVSELQLSQHHQIPTSSQSSSTAYEAEAAPQRTQGWALKAAKRAPRLQENVKQFLTDKFNKGVQTGNKADPLQLAREMQHRKTPSGSLEFAPHEWRTH